MRKSAPKAVASAIALVVLLYVPSVMGAADDDGWGNLSHIGKRTTYVFVDRNLRCEAGRIITVTRDSVVLRHGDSTTTTLPKQGTFRVMEREVGCLVLYSGRSSWADVRATFWCHTGKEAVRIVTKSGKQFTGRIKHTSDTDVTLAAQGGRGEMKFPKGNISQVYSLATKPPSDGLRWSAGEMGHLVLLDPESWPYYLHIAGRISVRLYDSSMPEDNTVVKCSNNP